jgi:hypothetical protein
VKSQAQHKAQELRQNPQVLGGIALAVLAATALVVWRRRR